MSTVILSVIMLVFNIFEVCVLLIITLNVITLSVVMLRDVRLSGVELSVTFFALGVAAPI